jgi:hypothetical protein
VAAATGAKRRKGNSKCLMIFNSLSRAPSRRFCPVRSMS